MKFCRVIPTILPLIVLLFSSSCNGISGSNKQFEDSPMYDLSKPKVINLNPELDEISGIVYYPKDTSVFAIVDENNVLYKISLNNPLNIGKWPFDKKRDFEDIVLIDSTFYILVSNGDVIRTSFDGNVTKSHKIDFPKELGGGEFESLYANPADSGSLIIMCKDCTDDKKSFVSAFQLKLSDSSLYQPAFKLDLTAVNDKLGIEKHLKPSAATINPVTGDLYVLSTIQSLLLIASPEGKVKEYYKLDPKIYKQAEGIAFTPDGDMIISNEFGETGFANLLLFKNKLKK